MDNGNKTPEQRRAERRKYMRIQQGIRIGGILLAIVLSIAALCQSCSTKKAIKELSAQLAAKKAAQTAQAAAEEEATASPAVSEPAADQTVTLSFIGACSLANPTDGDANGSFEEYYENYGASYFFQNVKSIFEGDDLTVANLESTLTLSENRADAAVTFRADPSHVNILECIDAVNVANDHIFDFGDEGYVDTLAHLDNAGIHRFGYDNTLLLTRQGVTLGLCGVFVTDDMAADLAEAEDLVAELKTDGAQIVVVLFHWNEDGGESPTDGQITLAHRIIDAGADLVVGHNPTIQGIEVYKGKYIAYSLGTFCTGGEAAEMDTMIFQQTFSLTDGVLADHADYQIIPCSISAVASANTYCPTPSTGTAAAGILDKIYARSNLLDGGLQPETASDLQAA